MASGVAYPAFGLALLATVGILFTTCFREWKRNSVQSSQANVMQIYIAEGLWVRCTSPYVGQFQCDSYDTSFIAIPPQVQGMRAMMCLSTLFEVIAVVCSIIAMPCVAALSGGQKLMTSRVGGVLSLLAGALCLASVSWYAADIIFQFWSATVTNQTFKYEFGSALYVGWLSSALAILSGILLLCCNCSGGEEVDESYRYNYKPAAKPATRAAEYV